MASIITKDFGITNAINFEKMISLPLANVYILMGRSIPWSNVSNTELYDDSEVPDPYDTVDMKNWISRDGLVMVKITSNDVQPVIPRVDWANTEVYVPYDHTLNTFTKSTETKYNGNVNVSVSTLQTVNSATINLASVNPVITVGSLIRIGEEIKEVCDVHASGASLTVNTPFSSAYTNANLYKVVTTTTQYANKFYVRNIADQVFKCMDNNSGANSTVMPEITLGGQLPENPFIETSDGYKWKYMYTIPSGLKNKFFTDKYMPVIREPIVFENAENGRIDIIQITDGGSGYFSGGSVNNYAIVDVTGDGANANVTVDVTNGVITNINIIDGGNTYTTATITLDDTIQTFAGNTAELRAVISPRYGHGFDPVKELGGSDQMISVDFEGDLNGLLPTQGDGTEKVRQISIIKDPKLANGVYATSTVYPMYTSLQVSNPPVDFSHGTIVYAGSSFETSTFNARVIHFDNNTNMLYINRIVGNVSQIVSETIYEKDNPSAAARVFSVTEPDINIFTGEVLFIENKSPIIRSPNQTETVKLVVEF